VDLSATGDDLVGDVLPKLAGAELGVEEALDEGGVGGLLLDVRGGVAGGLGSGGEGLLEEVLERGGEGEALDALRAPLGGDLVAGSRPKRLIRKSSRDFSGLMGASREVT
jgi:hypothetical protein